MLPGCIGQGPRDVYSGLISMIGGGRMRGARVDIRISAAQKGSAQRARLHGELYIIIIIIARNPNRHFWPGNYFITFEKMSPTSNGKRHSDYQYTPADIVCPVRPSRRHTRAGSWLPVLPASFWATGTHSQPLCLPFGTCHGFLTPIIHLRKLCRHREAGREPRLHLPSRSDRQ